MSDSNPSPPPKLIIDSDWKSQAQAEKEKLAAQERERAAKQPAGGAPAGGQRAGASKGSDAGMPDMPEANFDELLRLLLGQALLYMGAFPDPETGRAVVSLEMAKLHIDLLQVVETKTKGNLTPEESSALTRVLAELRMQFVEVAKAVAKAVQEGRLARPGAGPGGGAGGFGAEFGSGFGAGGMMGGAGGGMASHAPPASGFPNLQFPST